MKFKALLFAFAIISISLLAACGKATGKREGETVVVDTSNVDTTSVEGKIQRLTELLKFGPRNWRLWFDRSVLWYEKGNAPRAMDDINKSIELSLNEPETYHMRGFYYYVQLQDSAALRDFRRAADLNSDNPETYFEIGNIYFFQKAYSKADSFYDRAIQIDSMQPTYYIAKGLLRQEKQNIDAAIVQFNLALKRDPMFVKALLALHDIYLNEKNDPDQAYTYNERAMLIDSTQPLAHFNQANFFMARANRITDPEKLLDFQVIMKLALSEFNLCLRYDPKFEQAFYNRGYTFYLLGKYQQALEDFNKATELDPFNRDAFYMKGNVQEFQGDLKSALENYRRALDLDPTFKDAKVAVKELTAKLEYGKSAGG